LVARNYWLDLFPGTTWEELAAGGEVSGFRERRWKTVQQIKPGDYLLCHLTGISRWIGVLEIPNCQLGQTPVLVGQPLGERGRAPVPLAPQLGLGDVHRQGQVAAQTCDLLGRL